MSDERLNTPRVAPRELAVSGRSWRGSVPINSFERLPAHIGNGGAVRIDLTFSIDDEGRTRVRGSSQVDGMFDCHRCLEQVRRTVRSEVDLCVVRTEREAERLISEFDTVVVEDRKVAVQELVEDDLLLSVPISVCPDGETCENMPTMQYPVDSDEDVAHPFSQLRKLKKGG